MTVAIIGGGFSGTMVAVNLAKAGRKDLRICLIEKSGVFGRGVAYGTKNPNHLLNVPASNMSAFPNDKEHFVKWLGAEGDAQKYYPRMVYGDYVESILSEAGDAVEKIAAAAVRLKDGLVTLDNGEAIKADYVVLALGNLPPVVGGSERGLFQLKQHVFFNPWGQAEKLSQIEGEARVLIIGTGLTMVDMALGLSAQSEGLKITAVSRHGLLPGVHVVDKPAFPFEVPEGISVLEMLRLLRRKARQAADVGAPWQSVIDQLRPVTTRVWRGFSIVQKKQFVNHLRSYWDVHRHRMSKQVFERLELLKKAGRFSVRAARLININPLEEVLEVVTKPRGSKLPVVVEVYDYVINCAAPESNYREAGAMMRKLFEDGQVCNGPLNMGLKATVDGRVINGSGSASSHIFTLGPTCRGELWESIAVPEIREQAAGLAKIILSGVV